MVGRHLSLLLRSSLEEEALSDNEAVPLVRYVAGVLELARRRE